jgi:hypothetical protein
MPEKTSAQPARAGFAPGCHSSPGLKAWGFLAWAIKTCLVVMGDERTELDKVAIKALRELCCIMTTLYEALLIIQGLLLGLC